MPDNTRHTASASIVVIGTASLDVLHLGAHTVSTVGGAGLYTALAAVRRGATVALYAPRPTPMPAALQPVAARLAWSGPTITPDALPRLEIAQHGGGRATLLAASWGAEAQLTPACLPAAVRQAAFVHIAALSTAQRQLDFLQALITLRGEQPQPRLSVGTYARLAYGETVHVRTLLARADVFFMNENEATGLFGSVEQAHTRPTALLFVTLGSQGVLLITGDTVTHLPGHAVAEVDATGAGDTFCGATLAGLARGASPVVAAEQAMALAARTVGAVGPAALL
jgi:sugar/nucleoside kinase (ribokinase family)